MKDHATWRFESLDHVQMAMPAGQEDLARRFYVDVLGFREVDKPPVLAARGGCWFEFGLVHLHLGVEVDFRPARKAHPAVVVSGLDAMLAATGLEPRWAGENPAIRNCYVDDPFGNRIELIDASTGDHDGHPA